MDRIEERKTDNRRTGWILATVVVVFFLGVIARRWLLG
ncbi:MAG TPA: cytochrome oxidase small assembly protein [Burkholderiaceae bacterium]|jgi:hypothetical protein|nr:cytochrome oxidase small assembly protein [Burkholderiaceae bacterium]HPE02394.1 cytochrome oxidase small assembly protein [Burkholderiaceae bacterium]HRZ00328.1 cytochrome oxidase small assembly protein [Burkholderiaceae bacterium]